jgi:hypothetical protein
MLLPGTGSSKAINIDKGIFSDTEGKWFGSGFTGATIIDK